MTTKSGDHGRSAANPWLREPDAAAPADEAIAAVAVRERPVLRPGGQGALPSVDDPLRRIAVPTDAALVWWMGVHGGAGETTLAELTDGSRAAGHAWPIADVPAPVAIVARTHARGLLAAQSALREWASGDVGVDLVGLVAVADAPGRPPKALKDLLDLVAGGAPRVWAIPWVEAWRLGDPIADHAPRAVIKTIAEITHTPRQRNQGDRPR